MATIKTKKAVAKKTTSKQKVKKKSTLAQIEERAYQIYVEKGYSGSAEDNWLQAEKELLKA